MRNRLRLHGCPSCGSEYTCNCSTKQWKCEECGQIVFSDREPLPLRWEDGHVCKFKEVKE